MMRRDGRGRQASRRNSEFHMRLHVAAQERAAQMVALLKAGKSYHEVGAAFGVTAQAVRSALKRQGLLK